MMKKLSSYWVFVIILFFAVTAYALPPAPSLSPGSIATDPIFDAAGDTIYGTGSNTSGRLAIGTAYQLWMVNAGATAPAWTSTLGATDTRLTAGFFTDLTVTNAIAGSVTGNAATTSVIVQAGANNVLTYTGNYSLGVTLTGNTAVTMPTSGTLATTAQLATDNSTASHFLYQDSDGNIENATTTGSGTTMVLGTTPTLTSPVINGATGTGGKFTGDLTGLMPSVVLTHSSGVHDGADDAATMTDSGESFTTSQFVGMTVYNITDGSSCTVTANDGTTITCTLAGGTGNDWDTNDVWQVGPGPSQSGSWFYVVAAGTIRHPATVGYTACYESDATAAVIVDFASDSMIFQGVLDSAVQVNSAGHYISSSGSTTGDFQCIHNKSVTEGQGKGKRGTWTKEADD
jgi:hypothetical protein